MKFSAGPMCHGFVFGLIVLMTTFASADNFYVAPNGSDANPGTVKRPFATIERAQSAVRGAKNFRRTATTVFLRGGTYYLEKTLVFSPEDSGTQAAPILYRAYRDEKPVLSGGSKLSLEWQPYKDGILKASVPAGMAIDQLFVNGQGQNMARYPNFDPKAEVFNGYAADAFSKERAARWADPKGGYIHAMHRARWGDYHYLITGKDAAGEVTYEGGWQNNRQMGMHPQYRFVENIFEELDAPGEWFLNGHTNTLYFYPPVGVDMSHATVETVRLRHLVEFRGTEAAPVRFVTLQGLTFQHAARTFMDNKEPLLRTDWTTYRGGALFYNGCEDCALLDCTISQVGGNAVFINNYNRRVVVRGCLITEAGANGVAFIGDPDAVRSPLFNYNQVQDLAVIDRTPGPKTNNYPADCIVDDCLITRTGRVEKQTAPVEIDMAQSITVRHCSIYDVPRAGINIGDGAWGGHLIEWCDVFDTVKETGDHGSFNSWGRDRFWRPSIPEVNAWVAKAPDLPLLDVVKPNIIRNSRWRCDHGWDIDLDDGSSNYLIYNNLCLNGGLKNREGFRRTVENNVIINSFHPHVWYANSGDIFRHNIVSTPYHPIRVNKPWGQEVDFNVLYQPGQKAPIAATELQNQSGRDIHSLVADAQFVNAAQGDFRVRAGSPALKLGFKNFPMDGFGVQKPALKAIARTPSFVLQTPETTAPKRDATVGSWLGAKVRNIVGQGEMSAFGLPGETGVLVLESTPALSAFDVRKDDVILGLDGQKTDTLSALQRITTTLKTGQQVALLISRLQKQSILAVRIGENMTSFAPESSAPENPVAPFPGQKIDWNGFDRYQFPVGQNKMCSVIVPKQPLAGHLWAWKGEFLDAFPKNEIELLKRGVYIVALAVPNLFGCPEAVGYWNECYAELTTHYGMAKKPALIGLSRGGLYCYNWAIANPDKVACIYGDAPVCDLKSWPGGKGKGPGSSKDWQLAMKVYGFKDEAAAMAYQGNPIDNLKPLADAKIPIIHVYGDADELLPWEENTGIVATRYRALGGSIQLIAKPGIGHHPHGLDDPTPTVEFILRSFGVGSAA